MSIEVKALTFSYNGQDNALENINITINNGELVGIMGQTGSGKSTLVQLIAGLIPTNDGCIFIDDDDIYSKRFDKRILRKKLGIVFQNPESQLFEKSVERDIAFALKPMKLSKNEVKERVINAMSLVGLDYNKLCEKSPLALSQGEKRRVAIAGVIVTDPDYLIFDEPFAGLDVAAREQFTKMLLDFKKRGKTVIVVSHNSDCLSQCADRVIVLDKGKIALDGNADYVFSQTKTLASLGVGSCNTKELVALFKSKNIDIDENIISYDDLLNELIRIFKK